MIELNDFTSIGSSAYLKELETYDLTRYCELEAMKTSWKSIEFLPESRIVMDNMYQMFEPLLSVESVEYDDIGFLLFKVKLKAKNIGKISAKELGVTIDIIQENKSLCNEVKKNCLLYDRKNSLEIRKNDVIVFYISKNK